MINLYAFTYPEHIAANVKPGYILTKVGDSMRDVFIRLEEQGKSSEANKKVIVGVWNQCKNISRDYVVHRELKKLGLYHKHGQGTEWFWIPGNTIEEAFAYLDALVSKLEGNTVRDVVKLRVTQQTALDKAMDIIANPKEDDVATVIANLCPRFGKTIWALMLFNKITEKYGNRVMLLPAYWLSVHSSFIDEISKFDDFLDMVHVDADKDEDAEQRVQDALANNQRVVMTISLCGNFDSWITKYGWTANIDNNDIYMFADEGDFGTHTENQVKKLEHIFS